MLLHAVFSGPRPRVDAFIALAASAGMAAAVDRDREGQPNTWFHALEDPQPILDPETGEPLVDDDGAELLMPPVLQSDEAGRPVWDNDLAHELEVEVLVDEDRLDDAVELAGRCSFRLRMHSLSGFSSYRQAEAVAAARDLPSRHPLLAVLESDRELLADFRRMLAEAQT